MHANWKPVPQHAVERIQQMILDGVIAPGDRLPAQRELAERLEVSRTSLREALSALETLGLVRVEPGRGAYVCEPSMPGPPGPWRFAHRFSESELYQLRFALEGAAVQLAALAATARDVAELRRILGDMRRALESNDMLAAAGRDFAFHQRLMDLSGNRAFREILASIEAAMIESQRLPLSRKARLLEPTAEHQEILAAVARHDPSAAAQAMQRHIVRAADRIGVQVVLPASPNGAVAKDTPRVPSAAGQRRSRDRARDQA